MSNQVKGWCAAIFIGLLWGGIPWIVGTPILEVMDAQVLVWGSLYGCIYYAWHGFQHRPSKWKNGEEEKNLK